MPKEAYTLTDAVSKSLEAGDGELPAPEAKKHGRMGGRQQGVLNKSRQELLDIIRAAVGDDSYHPLAAMARLAYFSHFEVIDPFTGDKVRLVPEMEQRVTCLKEVTQYIAPKLKAVEHSGDIGVNTSGVLRVPTGMSEEAWAGVAAAGSD